MLEVMDIELGILAGEKNLRHLILQHVTKINIHALPYHEITYINPTSLIKSFLLKT